jgi:hypothetical protein
MFSEVLIGSVVLTSVETAALTKCKGFHVLVVVSWLQQHVLRSKDEVHVVVVALPVPYPVRRFARVGGGYVCVTAVVLCV